MEGRHFVETVHFKNYLNNQPETRECEINYGDDENSDDGDDDGDKSFDGNEQLNELNK